MNQGFLPDNKTQRSETPISSNPFFPQLNLKEFEESYGLPKEMSNSLVYSALIIAIDYVNNALSDYRYKKASEGYNKLDLVPSDSLGEFSAKVVQYKQAVYSSAKATLFRNNISLDLKSDADGAAKSAQEMVEHYERATTRAIAAIQGERAIGIHLI